MTQRMGFLFCRQIRTTRISKVPERVTKENYERVAKSVFGSHQACTAVGERSMDAVLHRGDLFVRSASGGISCAVHASALGQVAVRSGGGTTLGSISSAKRADRLEALKGGYLVLPAASEDDPLRYVSDSLRCDCSSNNRGVG